MAARLQAHLAVAAPPVEVVTAMEEAAAKVAEREAAKVADMEEAKEAE